MIKKYILSIVLCLGFIDSVQGDSGTRDIEKEKELLAKEIQEIENQEIERLKEKAMEDARGWAENENEIEEEGRQVQNKYDAYRQDVGSVLEEAEKLVEYKRLCEKHGVPEDLGDRSIKWSKEFIVMMDCGDETDVNFIRETNDSIGTMVREGNLENQSIRFVKGEECTLGEYIEDIRRFVEEAEPLAKHLNTNRDNPTLKKVKFVMLQVENVRQVVYRMRQMRTTEERLSPEDYGKYSTLLRVRDQYGDWYTDWTLELQEKWDELIDLFQEYEKKMEEVGTKLKELESKMDEKKRGVEAEKKWLDDEEKSLVDKKKQMEERQREYAAKAAQLEEISKLVEEGSASGDAKKKIKDFLDLRKESLSEKIENYESKNFSIKGYEEYRKTVGTVLREAEQAVEFQNRIDAGIIDETVVNEGGEIRVKGNKNEVEAYLKGKGVKGDLVGVIAKGIDFRFWGYYREKDHYLGGLWEELLDLCRPDSMDTLPYWVNDWHRSLDQKQSRLNDRKEGLETQKAWLESQKAELESKEKALQDQAVGLQKMAKVKEELGKRGNSLTNLDESYKKQLEELGEQLDKNMEAISQDKSEKQDGNEIDDLKKQLEDKDEQLKSSEKSFEGVAQEKKKLVERVSSLENEIRELKRKLEAQTRELKRRVNEAKAETNRFQTENMALRNQMATLKEEKAELEHAKGSQETPKEMVKERVVNRGTTKTVENTGRIDALNKDVGLRENQMNEMQRELNSKDDQIRQLQQLTNQLRNQLKEQESKEKEKPNTEEKEESNAQEEELDKRRQKLEEAMAELEDKRNELNAREAEVSKREQTVDQMQQTSDNILKMLNKQENNSSQNNGVEMKPDVRLGA